MMGRRIFPVLFLCALEAAANYGFVELGRQFVPQFGGFRLFLDTAFTISAVFSGGIFAGILTALLSTLAYTLFDYPLAWVFGPCNVVTALVVWRFVAAEPSLSKRCWPGDPDVRERQGRQGTPLLDRVVMLALLSLCLCAVLSVLGGLTAVFIHLVLKDTLYKPPETFFKLGLINRGFTLLAAEIASRIPVNIADRFISVFVGYGGAVLLRKAIPPPPPPTHTHSQDRGGGRAV